MEEAGAIPTAWPRGSTSTAKASKKLLTTALDSRSDGQLSKRLLQEELHQLQIESDQLRKQVSLFSAPMDQL